jgi:hypothetical protein
MSQIFQRNDPAAFGKWLANSFGGKRRRFGSLRILAKMAIAAGAVAAGSCPASAQISGDSSGLFNTGALEADSSYLWLKTPNPFTFWAPNYHKNPLPYVFVTTTVTWSEPLVLPTGEGFLRGSWEGLVSGMATAITDGPEHHWFGGAVGLRYNFVPKGSEKWTPFVDFRGGAGEIDASNVKYGQERDLTFTFLIGLGVRYNLNKGSSIILETLTQHISNGWQTHPSEGVDLTGLAIGWRDRF